MIEDKVSFCGFVSFIKQKCISGYYATSIRSRCYSCLDVFLTIILFLLAFIIGFCALLYGTGVLFSTIGRIASLTQSCSLIACITSEQYIEQASNPLFFQAREKNECCSCNTTSETYNNYDIFIASNIRVNTCNADGYVDYILTGLICFIFVPMFFLIIYLFGYTLKSIYNGIKTQWNKYIGKKNDSRAKYMHLDIKDSNIIYQDDIELGKRHIQTHEIIKEVELELESDTNSTNSEDGILIDISDAEGYSIQKID